MGKRNNPVISAAAAAVVLSTLSQQQEPLPREISVNEAVNDPCSYEEQPTTSTKVPSLWYNSPAGRNNTNDALTKKKSLASMVNHPTSKDAVRRKLEKQISIIPGTRSRRVRQFPKEPAATGTTTESNTNTTTTTPTTTMDDSKKEKKKNKESLLSSSHHRRRLRRRSAETFSGSKQRGRLSPSPGPLRTSATNTASEEKKQRRKESRRTKPKLQRSNSGSALDLCKKKASGLDAADGGHLPTARRTQSVHVGEHGTLRSVISRAA